MSSLWCCQSSISSADHDVGKPSKMPWRMILERPSWRVTCPNHASFRLLTVAKRSCGSRTRRWSCAPSRRCEAVPSCTSFRRPGSFSRSQRAGSTQPLRRMNVTWDFVRSIRISQSLIISLLLWVICVLSCHRPSRLLFSKKGQGVFNVRNDSVTTEARQALTSLHNYWLGRTSHHQRQHRHHLHHQSPWAHLHVVGMLRFMSDINQLSLPTPF